MFRRKFYRIFCWATHLFRLNVRCAGTDRWNRSYAENIAQESVRWNRWRIGQRRHSARHAYRRWRRTADTGSVMFRWTKLYTKTKISVKYKLSTENLSNLYQTIRSQAQKVVQTARHRSRRVRRRLILIGRSGTAAQIQIQKIGDQWILSRYDRRRTLGRRQSRWRRRSVVIVESSENLTELNKTASKNVNKKIFLRDRFRRQSFSQRLSVFQKRRRRFMINGRQCTNVAN